MTIYFYKAGDPYGCFSNFSPHPILQDGLLWPTVEHYYQAQKFGGTAAAMELMTLIRQAPTAAAAAALGRDPARSLRPDWDGVKREIMLAAVRTKFHTHGEIRAILLGTGEEVLVEDSPTDYYWGCGCDRTGANHLGRILMQVRSELRDDPGQGEFQFSP